MRFDGVGGGPWDEKARHVFHGPGPSSQLAVFTRLAPSRVPSRPSTGEGLPHPPVVWESAAVSEAAGTAAALTRAAHID